MTDEEYELDEYPTSECDHCGDGPCHFATRDRCIKTCIYGPDYHCTSGKHESGMNMPP